MSEEKTGAYSPGVLQVWETAMQEMQEIMGPPPRVVDASLQARLIPKNYFTVFDSLGTMLKRREGLLQTGMVTWGCILRPDEDNIFEPGSKDVPADILFCANPAQKVIPSELVEIVKNLWSKVGTREEDRAYNRILEYLEIPHARSGEPRAFGLRFSYVGYDLMVSTILIERGNFPGNTAVTIFPILIDPNDGAAMMLPGPLWPRQYAALVESHLTDKYPYFWQRLHIPQSVLAIVIVVVTLIIVIALIVVQR
jgi:hypothetical protein